MTAEIAIINKTAVTLAADSAVTLKIGGKEKIYNSADKIFELSAANPIGLMVYNNLEFAGIPIEVIAKDFRNNYAQNENTVFTLAETFLQHLSGLEIPDKEIKEYIYWAIKPHFLKIRDKFNRNSSKIVEVLNKKFNDKKKSQNKLISEALHNMFLYYVNEASARIKSRHIVDSLKDLSVHDVSTAYIDVINQALNDVFGEYPLIETDNEALRSIAINVLLRDAFSEQCSGFVFAGFGKQEIFPSLVSYEIDGIVCGKLKYKIKKTVDIDRKNQVYADIIPFAQKEMVDRFVYGIDPDFINFSQEFVAEALNSLKEKIEKHLVGSKAGKVKKISEILKAANLEILNTYRDQAIPEQRESFKKQMSDTVRFMPKQELAAMAESLVNITSLKRRFSVETESVGGPIDVAMITRSEGFVWVKRKHYFDPSLNPRFFHRKFGSVVTNGGKTA